MKAEHFSAPLPVVSKEPLLNEVSAGVTSLLLLPWAQIAPEMSYQQRWVSRCLNQMPDLCLLHRSDVAALVPSQVYSRSVLLG